MAYEENRAGMAALLKAPFLVDEMRKRAERVKGYAEVIAPVDTGRYRDSFRISFGVDARSAFGRVRNLAPYSYFVEFGTCQYATGPLPPRRNYGGMRRHRTLGRALDAARN